MRVLRRLDGAMVGRILGSTAAVLLGDLAVFPVRTHPLAQVAVQLAAVVTTLAAVDLPLQAHALKRVRLAVTLSSGRGSSRAGLRDAATGEVESPLQVVGSVTVGRQWNTAVHATVDIVEVAVGQAQACTIHRIEVVHNGVVKLNGKIKDIHTSRGPVGAWWRLVLHDRVGAAWGRKRRPANLGRMRRILHLCCWKLALLGNRGDGA